jgi:hypothetical protein
MTCISFFNDDERRRLYQVEKEKNNPNNNNGSNNLNECCRGEDHPVVISRTEAAAAKYWGKMKEYLKGATYSCNDT